MPGKSQAAKHSVYINPADATVVHRDPNVDYRVLRRIPKGKFFILITGGKDNGKS